MTAYVLTAAAMSLPALGVLRCCCRRRVFTAASASLSTRPSGALIIDTDCALDDLATLALAAATGTSLQLVTTVNGLAPPGHGHELVRRMLDALEMRAVPVVAGAEEPPSYVVREKAAWEQGYDDRRANAVAQLGIEPAAAPAMQSGERGTAAAAADAIVESARAAGGATVLALGALTNLAAACERHPHEFRRSVERVIFIADAQPARTSFNVQCDPQALATVLRSGVELVLIGQPCYPRPAWVEALFSGGARSSEGDGDELDQESVLRPRQLSRAAQATPMGTAESQRAHPEAALRLRRLGALDPYAYCYDPLALLYLLQPDAFDTAASLPVRVTADGLLERCSEAEAQGRALEPQGVELARYEAFLRQASAI